MYEKSKCILIYSDSTPKMTYFLSLSCYRLLKWSLSIIRFSLLNCAEWSLKLYCLYELPGHAQQVQYMNNDIIKTSMPMALSLVDNDADDNSFSVLPDIQHASCHLEILVFWNYMIMSYFCKTRLIKNKSIKTCVNENYMCLSMLCDI